MSDQSFYDAGALKQVAINLFYGWGYNFYRVENQLRTDDQTIRAKAGWLLGLAQASVDATEAEFRREFLPPPSRARPYPDPQVVKDAQDLERLGKSIGSLVARLHALPVPENDRMTQRFRTEAMTLANLKECDALLVGQCDLLRTLLNEKSAAWMLANATHVAEGLRAIGETLIRRQEVLV